MGHSATGQIEGSSREPARDHPSVSYIMPVLNEADSLESAVTAILSQDWDLPVEVILAIGPSHDGTEAIAGRLAAGDSRIKVVANPRTDIPAALNGAIAAATGDVVVRVDAHAELPPEYTRVMVSALERSGAANVGGVMNARGRTPVQQSIARVYNSPLGLGGGVYHGGSVEGVADSAYLGVFRRAVLSAVGGYDESVRRGEDYDLNQRIRDAGHTVWFTPDVEVTYWPRSSWTKLAQQMWATGAWRGELVRRGSRTPWRYFVPPALVLGLAVSAGTGLAQGAGASRWPWSIAHAAPVAYAGFLTYGATRLGAASPSERLLDARALATVHLAWGAGFVRGIVTGAATTVDRSRVTERPDR